MGVALATAAIIPRRGVVHEVGSCTYFDADGDKIFENYEVSLKDSSDRTPGTVHITGGTGKYQGITGTLAVTVEVLQPLGPGHTMWTGDAIGEYKIGQ
jgi:hypothetical protein